MLSYRRHVDDVPVFSGHKNGETAISVPYRSIFDKHTFINTIKPGYDIYMAVLFCFSFITVSIYAGNFFDRIQQERVVVLRPEVGLKDRPVDNIPVLR